MIEHLMAMHDDFIHGLGPSVTPQQRNAIRCGTMMHGYRCTCDLGHHGPHRFSTDEGPVNEVPRAEEQKPRCPAQCETGFRCLLSEGHKGDHIPVISTVPRADAPTPVPDGMTNPKDLVGATKPPIHLVPPALLIYTAQAFKEGAQKYGPYNWRQKKVQYTIYISAAMRHILQVLDGEDIDPGSGCPHAAHAAACLAVILDAQATGNLIDDRPTKGVAAQLIRDLTETREKK